MATLDHRRTDFLQVPRHNQKLMDLREVFESTRGEYLTARCISPEHEDNTPSMCIYRDGVSCRGCGRYWWPDEFLIELGQRSLETEPSGSGGYYPKDSRPSLAVAETYCHWLTDVGGPYESRLTELYSRGLRRDSLILNRIGHNGEGFSIPIFDPDLKTIRYRRDDERSPDRPKYWGTNGSNEPLIYRPLISAYGRPVPTLRTIIVEGELDALRLAQEGYRVVTITNGIGALYKNLVGMLPASPTGYLICVDNDAPGAEGGSGMRRALATAGYEAALVTWGRQLGKDVTELLNRWPLSEFDRYVRKAEQCVFGE